MNAVSTFPIEAPIDMAPPKEEKSVDVSRMSFTLQMVVTIVAAAISAAVGVLSTQSATKDEQALLRSDMRVIIEKMNAQDEVKRLEKQILDQRFESLEAKIEAAGLRNAAMSLSQELQRAQKR